MSQRGRALRAVVLAGLVVVGGGCGDDDDTAATGGDPTSTSSGASSASSSTLPASSTSTSVVGPSLTGAAAEFAAAIEAARPLTYHARYEGQSVGADGSTVTSVVEVWRRAPLARRDLTLPARTGVLRVREYRTVDGQIGCFELTDSPGTYQCQPIGEGQGIDPAQPLFEAVDPGAGPVEAVDDEVDGIAVRCFQVAGDTAQEACFDGEGIPAVIDDGSLRLVRTALDTNVTDADLTPPSTG